MYTDRVVGIQTVFDEGWRQAWERAQGGRGGVLVFYGRPEGIGLDRESLRQAAGEGGAVLRPADALRPFQPVLGWVKAWWQRQDYGERQEFLRGLPRYPYVSPTFARFLQARMLGKAEPLLSFSTEIRTAQRHMERTIARLWLRMVRRTPRLFYIEDFHHASPSLVRLVLELQSQITAGLPLLLVLFLEREAGTLADPLWSRFFERVGKDGVHLSHSSEAPLRGDAPPPPPSPQPPDLREVQEALQWLAYEEARDLCLRWLENAGVSASMEEELEAYLLLGKAYDCLQDHHSALMALSQVTNLALQTGDQTALAQAYLAQATVHLKQESFGQCQQQLEKIRRLNLPERDTIGLLAEVLDSFLVMAQYNRIEQGTLTAVMEALAQRGWKNLLMFLKAQTPYLLWIWREAGEREFQREWRSCFKFARSIEHTFRLSLLEHIRALIAQEKGETRAALARYRRAIALRTDFGDPLELTKIYNGAGYVCLQAGLLQRAARSFIHALELLERVEDFQEIILTLLNLGTTYLVALQVEPARRALESVMRLLNELGIRNLPFHPQSEVLCLTAWCSVWSGDPVKARNYRQMAVLAGGGQGDPLLVALDLCLDRPEPERPLAAVEAALRRVRNLPLGVWMRNLEALAQSGPPRVLGLRMPQYRFQVDAVLRMARQSLSLSRLHQRIHEIQFLNQLQNVIVTTTHWQDMVKESMRLIKNSFPISHMYLIMLNELRQKELVFAFPEEDSQVINVWSLETFLDDRPDLCLLPTDQLPAGWHRGAIFALSHQAQVYGWLVCGFSTRGLEPHAEDLKSIQIGVSQISLAVELKRVNEKLIRSSTIDPVTGLLNRQEIYRQVANELRRVRRYRQRNYGPFSLLFIDLDHFKFYNESFGSELGDHLLRCFADLLRRTLRDVDAAGRFGSDEFLVLLPETNLAGAQVAARRIVGELEHQQYFLKEINVFLRRRVVIPQNRFLTCSMGITEYNNTTGLDLEELLAVTDNALREARHSVKNVMIILPDGRKG